MYKRQRVTRKRLAATPRMSVDRAYGPTKSRLPVESPMSSGWDTLCGCCDFRIEAGQPVYFVKGSGLIRHQVCDATADYLERIKHFHRDVQDSHRNSARMRRRDAIRHTVELLQAPGHAEFRAVLLNVIKDAQVAHDLPSGVVDNVVPLRRALHQGM